jgi:hypothetical protein
MGENLAFKILFPVNNVPGHPTNQDVCEHIKVAFIPLNFMSLIQTMDQGAISTQKSCYLKKTFGMLEPGVA